MEERNEPRNNPKPADENRPGPIQEGNDRTTFMTDEENVLKMLEEQGYSDEYRVEKGKLCSIKTKNKYKAKDVKVVNFYRFEGISNPDDMSIVYVIETTDGGKGILTDAYGLYSDDDTGAFLQEVEMNKKTNI
jgi:hypothetical protein